MAAATCGSPWGSAAAGATPAEAIAARCRRPWQNSRRLARRGECRSATIDLKKDEARTAGLLPGPGAAPDDCYPGGVELAGLPGDLHPLRPLSQRVTGVDNVCERSGRAGRRRRGAPDPQTGGQRRAAALAVEPGDHLDPLGLRLPDRKEEIVMKAVPLWAWAPGTGRDLTGRARWRPWSRADLIIGLYRLCRPDPGGIPRERDALTTAMKQGGRPLPAWRLRQTVAGKTRLDGVQRRRGRLRHGGAHL